jgi:hypothetical protein
MKKLWIVLFSVFLSTGAFAEMQTFDMTADEIESALSLVDRIGAQDIRLNADCSQVEVVIESRVKSFNPARWSVTFQDGSYGTNERLLESDEIAAAIALFDRVEVPLVKMNSVLSIQTARIKSRVCGLSPAVWTVSYEIE